MKKFSSKTLVLALSLVMATQSVMAEENNPPTTSAAWGAYIGGAIGTAIGGGLHYLTKSSSYPSLGAFYVFLPAVSAVMGYAAEIANQQAEQIAESEAKIGSKTSITNTYSVPNRSARFLVQAASLPTTAIVAGGGNDPTALVLVEQADLDTTTQSINDTRERVDAMDNRVTQLEDQIHKNDKKYSRGIAALAAMGNVAMPSKPGKTAIGAGVGSYDGYQAVAVSISHRLAKFDRVVLQAGVGGSNIGKPVMRAGFSVEF